METFDYTTIIPLLSSVVELWNKCVMCQKLLQVRELHSYIYIQVHIAQYSYKEEKVNRKEKRKNKLVQQQEDKFCGECCFIFFSSFNSTRDYRRLHRRVNIDFLFFRFSKLCILIFYEILYYQKKTAFFMQSEKNVCLELFWKGICQQLSQLNIHICWSPQSHFW